MPGVCPEMSTQEQGQSCSRGLWVMGSPRTHCWAAGVCAWLHCACAICTHLAQGGHQVATVALTRKLGIAAAAGARAEIFKMSIPFWSFTCGRSCLGNGEGQTPAVWVSREQCPAGLSWALCRQPWSPALASSPALSADLGLGQTLHSAEQVLRKVRVTHGLCL